MRRFVAAAVLLGCSTLPALAQEETPKPKPPPKPKPVLPARISVDATSLLDGKEDKPNGMQYFLWKTLNAYRLRVDCARPTNSRRLDDYIARFTKWWEKKAPGDTQPVDLMVVAKQTYKYDAAKFYGEAQAHNFKGKVNVELRKPTGDVLATITFGFSWGKLLRYKLTKRQVQHQYNQMVHTGLAILILCNDSVRKLIPAAQLPACLEWVKTERTKLLELFQKNDGLRRSDLYKLLRETEKKGDKAPVKKAKDAPCDICGEPRGNKSPCPHCGVE